MGLAAATLVVQFAGGGGANTGASWILLAGIPVSLLAGRLGARTAAADAAREWTEQVQAAQRQLATSYQWPLLGLALGMPLVLHLGLFLALAVSSPVQTFLALFTDGAGTLTQQMGWFDAWIGLSIWVTFLAHTLLARRALRFVSRLEAQTLYRNGFESGLAAVGAATRGGLVPGLLFGGLPCAAIMFTGLCFVPWSFSWAARGHRRDRLALDRLMRAAEPGRGAMSVVVPSAPGALSLATRPGSRSVPSTSSSVAAA